MKQREMGPIKRPLTDPATYRGLVYILSGIPMGLAWFIALVTAWSLCAALLITPLSLAVAIGLASMTRGFAALEAELARSLLGADAHEASVALAPDTFWPRLRARFGPGFWRAQAYLLIRSLAGFPVGIAVFGLLVSSAGLILAPVWVPLVHGGAHLGFWRPHTFVQSLALVPAGLLLLPATLLIVGPITDAFRPIASRLLRADEANAGRPDLAHEFTPPAKPGTALTVHGAMSGGVLAVPVLIWALTSGGYFWPVWIALPLVVALGIHSWFVLLADRPSLVDRFRGSRVLASTVGVTATIEACFVAVWAITGHGYFWPIWTLLAVTILLAALALGAPSSSRRHALMAERIETLETSRAGAVDLQDTELRRIERDLHDGAQARLVALGMSLGMAEQKLAEDPESVGELIAEARAGAEHALRELRDLARGIHPPVLADRGLKAALASLASVTPMSITLSVDTPNRPAPAVETAAYFVVAEALANVVKHAKAEHVEIRIAYSDDTLELEVEDDGSGGANPAGTGLRGMSRRVEALDGTLSVTSPHGGPTMIRAELPCAS